MSQCVMIDAINFQFSFLETVKMLIPFFVLTLKGQGKSDHLKCGYFLL